MLVPGLRRPGRSFGALDVADAETLGLVQDLGLALRVERRELVRVDPSDGHVERLVVPPGLGDQAVALGRPGGLLPALARLGDLVGRHASHRPQVAQRGERQRLGPLRVGHVLAPGALQDLSDIGAGVCLAALQDGFPHRPIQPVRPGCQVKLHSLPVILGGVGQRRRCHLVDPVAPRLRRAFLRDLAGCDALPHFVGCQQQVILAHLEAGECFGTLLCLAHGHGLPLLQHLRVALLRVGMLHLLAGLLHGLADAATEGATGNLCLAEARPAGDLFAQASVGCGRDACHGQSLPTPERAHTSRALEPLTPLRSLVRMPMPPFQPLPMVPIWNSEFPMAPIAAAS